VFEVLQHTADVRLRVEAATLEELFRDAMRGMYAVMRAHDTAGAKAVRRTIRVDDSADRTSLLVDFLNEVLLLAHVGRESFTGATFTRLDETSVEAEVSGIAPASFEEDVKAVTYHEADVRREGETWMTTLVFDI
jgi:SHS2 domain-containing protein